MIYIYTDEIDMVDYRKARSIHLTALRELREHRRLDGSYPRDVGIKVARFQGFLRIIRLRLAYTNR